LQYNANLGGYVADIKMGELEDAHPVRPDGTRMRRSRI
jgi:hypothetical protein